MKPAAIRQNICNVVKLFAMVLIATAVGCGPSSKQILTLKERCATGRVDQAEVELIMGKPKCVREWKPYQMFWDYQVGGEKWTVCFNNRLAHSVVKNDRGWGDPDWSIMDNLHINDKSVK